jgi:DNA-damage-inducible protein D
MNKEEIAIYQEKFDGIAQIEEEEKIEFWFARDIMGHLDYDRWENFLNVIEKAVLACGNSGVPVENHFRGVTKMVPIGSGAERPVEDIMLTRYACYLIAQNGDPRKSSIAFAQTYFALQTRKQELIEEHMRLQQRLDARERLKESENALSRNLFERGVDEKGFARIRSKGDAALFGGKATQQMKSILAVPEGRPLADFLPTVTIAAKNLANEITNHNVTERDLQGEQSITREHTQNNTTVRNMLVERGIKPEALPAAEDLKKLERRVKSAEKKMIEDSALPEKEKES